jgi:peptide/nickel transport system substrate-binding protein
VGESESRSNEPMSLAGRLSRRRLLHLTALSTAGAWLTAVCTSAPTTRTPEPAGAGKLIEVLTTKPAKFSEAPMLTELVTAGKLPAIASRLPEEPVVLKPLDGIGRYGGTLRKGFTGTADDLNLGRMMHDQLIFWDTRVTKLIPNIAKSWEVTDNGRTMTFHLRKGMKWSDGAPFTANDFQFWYEDVFLDNELNPSKASYMYIKGTLGTFEKVDDLTIRYRFETAYPLFLEQVASAVVGGHLVRGQQGLGLWAPTHYMKQFHKKYASKEQLDARIAEARQKDWVGLFKFRNDPFRNVDCPTTAPWKPVTPITAEQWVMERNPYYFVVDNEGNQLPYIDRIAATRAENSEVLNLRTANGEYDYQDRSVDFAKYPVFKQNQDKAGYDVFLWKKQYGGNPALFFNQNWSGDAEVQKWLTNRDFRTALALGIDRPQINEAFFLGLGDPGNAAPGPESRFYLGPDSRKTNGVLDLKKANELLDKIGLDKKDAEGFRLRTDGKGRLAVELAAAIGQAADLPGISQMIAAQWAKGIGIQGKVFTADRSLIFTKQPANELQMWVWFNDGSDELFAFPTHVFAFSSFSGIGPKTGDWVQSAGRQGIKPDGDLLRVIELYDEAKGAPADRAVQLGKEIIRISYIDNVWAIGTVGLIPNPVVVSRKVGNVPRELGVSEAAHSPGNARPEQFYFKP